MVNVWKTLIKPARIPKEAIKIRKDLTSSNIPLKLPVTTHLNLKELKYECNSNKKYMFTKPSA